MRDVEQELRERDQRIDDLLEIVRQQAEEIQRLNARIAELEAALGQRKEANAWKNADHPTCQLRSRYAHLFVEWGIT